MSCNNLKQLPSFFFLYLFDTLLVALHCRVAFLGKLFDSSQAASETKKGSKDGGVKNKLGTLVLPVPLTLQSGETGLFCYGLSVRISVFKAF